jgi:hypothetical protein
MLDFRRVGTGGTLPVLRTLVAWLEDRLGSMVAAKLRRCAGRACGGERGRTVDADAG